MTLKIAIFDAVSDSYGSSKVCKLIANVLQNKYEVTKYTRHKLDTSDFEKITFPLLVNQDFRANPLKAIYTIIFELFSFWKLYPKLHRNFDLIYCNTFGTILVALIFSVISKKLVILHIHESASKSKSAQLILKATKKHFTKIVFVSDFTAGEWCLKEAENVEVIKNRFPINTQMVSRHCKFDICFVGRLTEQKGFLLLHDILAELDKIIHDQIIIVIAGGNPLNLPVPGTDEFKNIVVKFLGEVSNDKAIEIFSRSKLALVPSMYPDPYPSVALEAQAVGCLPLVSNLGGLPETVINKSYVMDKMDAETWSNKIKLELATHTFSTQTNIAEKFAEQFNFQEFEKKILKVISSE